MATSPGNAVGQESTIKKCPSTPNCVSSVDERDAHQAAPFLVAAGDTKAWSMIRATVAGLDRTRIVKESEHYLHAECRSRLFGFIDDLELELNPSTGVVNIRSASRVGYSDLGVNRRRVEHLRELLLNSKIIHSR